MGAGYSADKGGPLAELSSSWVLKYADSATKYASGSSLCVIKRGEGPKQLALCYQASDAAVEGSRQQHLRFALSKDGENFGPSKCVMWGPAPLWNPTMHYDAGKPGSGPARQRPGLGRRLRGRVVRATVHPRPRPLRQSP